MLSSGFKNLFFTRFFSATFGALMYLLLSNAHIFFTVFTLHNKHPLILAMFDPILFLGTFPIAPPGSSTY